MPTAGSDAWIAPVFVTTALCHRSGNPGGRLRGIRTLCVHGLSRSCDELTGIVVAGSSQTTSGGRISGWRAGRLTNKNACAKTGPNVVTCCVLPRAAPTVATAGDIPLPIAAGPGAFTLFGQWIALGAGPVLSGGTSAALSWPH